MLRPRRQNGFVQALTEELIGTAVRVTAVHPGIIADMLPTQPEWDQERSDADGLSNRNVVEAILYVLD